ncbi:MAG: 3-dehydroquinate synthase [Alcanivoracaceae bacterium]|nr:3-dehydroquinate synthase [Alcanivoracaceae bacterium]
MTSKIVNINLSSCSYDIFINDSYFDFSALQDLLCNRKIAIISNDIVAPLYLDDLKSTLSDYKDSIFSHILADGEHNKNLQGWNSILDFLAENNFNRSDLLISLGGGVICDMTGFAAASWMRGIDFMQVPTSLLAQVDASVGGKTGINHKMGKNLIGAFHQPQAVIINTSTLKTLPLREYKSGLGETVKYGLINKPQFTTWLTNNATVINNQETSVLTQLIAKCCQYKAEIVQQDEKESGIRALLNLGHTFAHAIETYTQYTTYTHGEAVAIGMVMAAELSDLINISDSHNLRKELEKHLQDFHLKIMLPKAIDANKLVELMRLDKKVINNRHRLILMKSIGNAFIQKDVCEKDILQSIKNCQQ